MKEFIQICPDDTPPEKPENIILAAPSNHHFSAYTLHFDGCLLRIALNSEPIFECFHLPRTSAEERVQTLELETQELRRGRDVCNQSEVLQTK